MDQTKIGKFIAECRKKKKLTQMELAEKLNITDRAVSKWENGRSMPDSSIMLELCNLLGITVNELLSGEVIEMKEYEKQAEENLLKLKKEKEEADKILLNLEIWVGLVSVLLFLTMIIIASYCDVTDNVRLLIMIPSFIFFFIIVFLLLIIEQKAGYYECQKCHHRYVPTYSSVLWAPHAGRTRYMKCPECGKRSWQKKVISKE